MSIAVFSKSHAHFEGKGQQAGMQSLSLFFLFSLPPDELGNKPELTSCVCDRRIHRAWRGFRAIERRRGGGGGGIIPRQ